MAMVSPRSFPSTVWAGRYQVLLVQTIAARSRHSTLTAESANGNSVLQRIEPNMLSGQNDEDIPLRTLLVSAAGESRSWRISWGSPAASWWFPVPAAVALAR